MLTNSKRWYFFLLRMALPAISAILFFVCLIFFIIIPTFEKTVMNERKEMTKRLTETAWSVLDDLHQKERAGVLSLEAAQKTAGTIIKAMRYGEKDKGYFWVLNLEPRMIVHPLRPDLEGTDVTEFEDSKGKRLFLEFTHIVKDHGSGYAEYWWQRMEHTTMEIVPKISFVKGFEPWGWIVGTGIYIDDVKHDLIKLIEDILLVSIGFTFVIGGIVFFIVVQGVNIERARQLAERNLVDSMDKYHALVEASTDGFIMLFENHDMITNKTIMSMLNYSEDEFRLLSIFDIFSEDNDRHQGIRYIESLISGKASPLKFEAGLINKAGDIIDVIITTSIIDLAGDKAIILIARDISGFQQYERKKAEDERDTIIAELQTSLHFLNHNITELVHNIVPCDMQTSIRRASLLMNQKKTGILLITGAENEFLGIITDQDMRKRVIAGQLNPETPVVNIMTAPIKTISEKALVFEAALVMQDENISCLAVEDGTGHILGIVDRSDLLKIQAYSAVSLMQSIQRAESSAEITARRERPPCWLRPLLIVEANPKM